MCRPPRTVLHSFGTLLLARHSDDCGPEQCCLFDVSAAAKALPFLSHLSELENHWSVWLHNASV
jgi:hypothetical protein